MPVIIDEVVITVQVGAGGSASAASRPQVPSDDTRALVDECVERVLEILARRGER